VIVRRIGPPAAGQVIGGGCGVYRVDALNNEGMDVF